MNLFYIVPTVIFGGLFLALLILIIMTLIIVSNDMKDEF